MKNVAIVTGANKGIGYAIVQNFLKGLPSDSWLIYLTSRNETLGNEAMDKLKRPTNLRYHQLDITDPNSRVAIIEFLKKEHPEGIKIWMNNAAIAYKNDATEPFSEQAEVSTKVNYFDTMEMTKLALPLMTQKSNFVNVSSMGGLMALKKCSTERYNDVMNAKTVSEVDALVKDFVNATKEGTHATKGWPETAYGFSKMALTKATTIMGLELKKDAREVIMVSCCPGYVDTDMSSHKGPLTIEQGALTPVFCATIRDPDFQGCFVNDRKITEWSKDSSATIVTAINA